MRTKSGVSYPGGGVFHFCLDEPSNDSGKRRRGGGDSTETQSSSCRKRTKRSPATDSRRSHPFYSRKNQLLCFLPRRFRHCPSHMQKIQRLRASTDGVGQGFTEGLRRESKELVGVRSPLLLALCHHRKFGGLLHSRHYPVLLFA